MSDRVQVGFGGALPKPCEDAIARNLVETSGTARALDGLDLEVATGEVHGYLGPKGAAKAATIRTLPGLPRQDSGHRRLLG